MRNCCLRNIAKEKVNQIPLTEIKKQVLQSFSANCHLSVMNLENILEGTFPIVLNN